MLNGLDLFTGIGGISLGLKRWVKPVCYCEIEPYSQAVILDRIRSGDLPDAPIWDDVTTLNKEVIDSIGAEIDIVYGGFPCQDISTAGHGKGLEGERSGLFFQISRLVNELRPSFVFLENVPAINIRGLDRVGGEMASLGYDCRWTVLSAAEVGASHQRERWWFLAKSFSNSESIMFQEKINNKGIKKWMPRSMAIPLHFESINNGADDPEYRITNDVPNGLDRIKGLGNSVVPLCVETAFQELMGLNPDQLELFG